MKTDEEIYKIGDRVCDCFNEFGWGTVSLIDLDIHNGYPIEVKFDNGNFQIYTINGRYNISDKLPTLSFTEYEILKVGFSQVRPYPVIEVDTPIFVKWQHGCWNIRYFSHFNNDNRAVCFYGELKSTETKNTSTWDEYSIENPLK